MTDTAGESVDARSWLVEIRAAAEGTGEADVACGGCTACCSSGQFVHIDADEVDTIAHIPADLLFPAPRSPAGHLLVGYDEDGRCPMLGRNGCTIYEHRPRTCRTYDCRIFAAAGVVPDQPAVARAAARWTMEAGDEATREAVDAVARAARWLGEHPEVFPAGRVPGATGLALAALAVHELCLPEAGDDPLTLSAAPDPAAVRRRLVAGGG